MKDETVMGKKGKRAFLNKEKNKEFLDRLEKELFQSTVIIPRVNVGKKAETGNTVHRRSKDTGFIHKMRKEIMDTETGSSRLNED